LNEALAWTLRALAPEDAVLAWHAETNRGHTGLNNGRPTRTLLLRYIVKDELDKYAAMDFYIKGWNSLRSAIEGPKHALKATDPKVLIPTAMTVEGLLHLLLKSVG
jgi:hypothetical protein